MFRTPIRDTKLRSAVGLIELIYVNTVQDLRKSHRYAILAIVSNMTQALTLLLVFYIMISLLGMRSMAIRGDFVLYILSGIFMYLTHSKAIGAIMGASALAPMMLHAPMNTAIAMASSALSCLYTQTVTVLCILLIVNVAWHPVIIDKPIGAIAMFLLAWLSGLAVGMVFLAISPWMPRLANVASSIYRRANMLASGKMFVANTMGSYVLAMFDWNPLFHIIDQARGFTFINYNPLFSSISYPIKVSVVLIVIGLMGEFYTRRHVSASWSAGR